MAQNIPNAILPVPLTRDGRIPKISSGFGQRSSGNHPGVDIMYERKEGDATTLPQAALSGRKGHPGWIVPEGTPAIAIAPGIVEAARKIHTGGYVLIKHADGFKSEYMHLRDIRVEPREEVARGSVIGIVSHNPSGYKLDHLHFQLRKGGRIIDPEPLMKTWTAASNPLEPGPSLPKRTQHLALIHVMMGGMTPFGSSLMPPDYRFNRSGIE